MKKTIFVEESQLKQMMSYKPYVNGMAAKRKMKYELLDQVEESIGEKWYRLKEGTRQTYDMLCFLATELGFVYASDKYLADRHGISDRTVRARLNELIKLGHVVKVYRRARRCNGRGKPVYLFVNHPYFTYWAELLKLDSFLTNFQTENDETSTESKTEESKKVSTYSLPKTSITYKDTAINNNRALRQSIPKVIYDAMAPFFNADELYKTYGVLLRAKAKVNKSIILEEHGEDYVDVFYNVIRKYKRGKVGNLDGYLYTAWEQVTAQISRRIGIKNSSFYKFLEV